MATTEARSIFATRLYNLRARNGLTQQRLAALIGVTQQSIWKWETDRSEPNIEKLRRLAELFKVPTDMLLGLTDMKEPAAGQTILGLDYHRNHSSRDDMAIGDIKAGTSVLVRASELEDVVQRLVSRYISGAPAQRPESDEQKETAVSASAQ